MKIILIIFFTMCSQIILAQSIKIGLGLGHEHHYANFDKDNPPKTPEVPSIGVMFGDAPKLFIETSYFISDQDISSNTIFFSLIYERSNLGSAVDESGFIMGDDLLIQNYGLQAGYSFNVINKTTYGLIFLGIIEKDYEGTSKLENDIDMVATYKSSTAIRLGLGAECNKIKESPFSLALKFTYDIGTIERDKIKFFENSKFAGQLVPDGDLKLPDNTLSINLSIFYNLSI